ncbi:hypothetical protein M438DRAFT_383260 [Aureobasidium pullulans EXF-150]|uniref:Uncharacterized protein n=2 Tax=Aureobasidium pullulans TaxID=5580 RepID=A0A074X8K1_AURPU|nr:uncharacterized protein M438DRAFT_383260 [Aureobasidium pullulans EXF-150]KEQ81845.1 hypothetical protein M438DRAFT_383260 [Aureobasidium pullulans EXF-150]
MRLRSKAASSPQITPRGHVVLASLHGAHPHFLSIAGQVNSSRNKKDLGERQLLSARRALGRYDARRRLAVADKGTRKIFSSVSFFPMDVRYDVHRRRMKGNSSRFADHNWTKWDARRC